MHRYLLVIVAFLSAALASQIFADENIYEHTQAGMLSPTVKDALPRVYVPNGGSNTLMVIDPADYKIVATYHTGRDPQHVVPSYDMQTLWVLNNKSNSMTPINPVTSMPGKSVPIEDPYNLYFTPDGKYGIVVSEGLKKLQFVDPKTMKLIYALPVNCRGANHMDFTSDNRYALVTCEYSDQIMKIDLEQKRVANYLTLSTPVAKKDPASEFIVANDGQVSTAVQPIMKRGMPQDIRSSPDGKLFFIADMMRDGLILLDPDSFTQKGFIHTGIGTHGIYPSRDGKLFYVSNRGCHMLACGPHGPGSISVVDPVKKIVVATWQIPNGGSPDMGNITADGKELWLAGRYDREVYVFNTETGKLIHRIAVGAGPHGLGVWPQPGEYSLGHTGNMR